MCTAIIGLPDSSDHLPVLGLRCLRAQAERILDEISCGILFLGVDGIDLDFGLSITNLAEANLNKKMIESAQIVAILADSTKFGRRGLGKVCELDQVQFIITDEGISPGTLRKLNERGIKILIAHSS
ncbi:DeoR/GlpR family DNA-binding transcription regulator [Arachidicoccus soli]|uniref:hypothetical protein n=1 Tax=Arachidicoccus soli TaxID=2341117 RepID=UPI001F08C515|nr:hypothetical protein [Arachidicoccus soli]